MLSLPLTFFIYLWEAIKYALDAKRKEEEKEKQNYTFIFDMLLGSPLYQQ
jgi:hypothetical protein